MIIPAIAAMIAAISTAPAAASLASFASDFMFVMDLNPDGVSFDNGSLVVGDRVRVVKGDLTGVEGEVATNANRTYVVIRIKDILTASVKVPKSYLKIIK